MGGHATAEERRIYVDQIDEAMQRAQRDGGRKLGARAPRRQLADLALRRLKDSEKLSKAQRKLLKTHAGDLEFTRAFNATTKTITNLIDAVRRGHEAEREAFSGLTEEQLDAVFRSQIPRIAPTLDESERRAVLEIWFGTEVAAVLLQPRELAADPTSTGTPPVASHPAGSHEPVEEASACQMATGSAAEPRGVMPSGRRGGHIVGCLSLQPLAGACTCPPEDA